MSLFSIFASCKVRAYVKHHINTALRLSGKLAKKEVSNEERIKKEHIIFVHLNASIRESKLF